MDGDFVDDVRVVVKEISSAAKALRLYPPTSTIPRQSADSAAETLDRVFGTVAVLSFGITKDGLAFSAEGIEQTTASADLARMLQSHGVAELSLTPGCDADQLVAFLNIAVREPEVVLVEGGIGLLLGAAGIEHISVSNVRLTVVDGALASDEEEVDDFLRVLAHDPHMLSTWLASATNGDPVTLQESLMELVRGVGDGGVGDLTAALSEAFMALDSGSRDVILGLALEAGPVQDLTRGMLARLSASDLAGSLCDGLYGKNMLSLSTTLAALPIGERFEAVMAEVRGLLPSLGHSRQETDFLDSMVEARRSLVPEPALVSQDPSYRELANRAGVDESEIATARAELADSERSARRRTVGTLLSLLDQQKDFALYCQTLDSLASLVQRLLESGDLSMAGKALSEITNRESRVDLPWPEVADRLRQARDRATGGRAMAHVLEAVIADEQAVVEARDIMRVAGDSAPQALVEAALSARDFDGLATAEQVLGHRTDDLLPDMATSVQWFQVATLARHLADRGDPRSKKALDTLVSRPDAQTRREVAKGLAASTNPAVLTPLEALLRDPSAEVATAAARALAASGASGTANIVARRIDELDIDGKDFVLAREMIVALERMRDPWARDVLSRLASRRTLVKRGHFAEIQALARRALTARKSGDS